MKAILFRQRLFAAVGIGTIMLMTCLSHRALAGTLFRDDFSSFSLGTVWQQTLATATLSTSVQADASRTVLHMETNSNDTSGLSTGAAFATAIAAPASQYSELDYTVVFEPLAGAMEPFETGIVGPGNQDLVGGVTGGDYARFLAFGGNWASNSSRDTLDIGGNIAYGVYYRGTIDIADSGTTETIVLDSNPSVVVYSHSFPDVTRAMFGGSVSIYMLQGVYPSGNLEVANVDYVNLDATPVPEPSSLGLLGLVVVGFLARRERIL